MAVCAAVQVCDGGYKSRAKTCHDARSTCRCASLHGVCECRLLTIKMQPWVVLAQIKMPPWVADEEVTPGCACFLLCS